VNITSMDYDNKLSGALFKNDKGDNPKRPDYKGSFTDGSGNEFWVSSWLKQTKEGKKFLSLSMQPKEAKAPHPAPVQEEKSYDLPF
jgi:uncharacterized protein (DUF736 family)